MSTSFAISIRAHAFVIAVALHSPRMESLPRPNSISFRLLKATNSKVVVESRVSPSSRNRHVGRVVPLNKAKLIINYSCKHFYHWHTFLDGAVDFDGGALSLVSRGKQASRAAGVLLSSSPKLWTLMFRLLLASPNQ